MPTVKFPDEPTPEVLSAITAALYAPLTLTAVADKPRERVIYRAILRHLAPAETKPVWRIEGSGRATEPTSHTLRVDAADIGKAVVALHADGFPAISISVE